MISRMNSLQKVLHTILLPSSNKCRKMRAISLRYNCSGPKLKALECLEHRSLLQVKGDEAVDYLQGLITNDMRHFDDGVANIYTIFLNIKGRVLYDSIIYRGIDKDSFYVECDSTIIDDLQKYLKIYKIRRKIDIECLQGKMKVWAVFDSTLSSDDVSSRQETTKSTLEGQIFPCGTLNNKSSRTIDDIIIYEDPRIRKLSFRVLSDTAVTREKIVNSLIPSILVDDNESHNYREFRYKLGIGEGVSDLPPGKALPLEINCDYLHGVSFHKGCYIGQELTARTHHTGVVRKRFMPLIFNEVVDKNFIYDENIVDENDKVVGKFRNAAGRYGLGLMRLQESLNAKSLRIRDYVLHVLKPCWWPTDSPKERLKMDEG